MTSDLDRKFMRIALREAKKGIGRTSPNPSVGAVIVKNGSVIATGYHKKAGTPHAEIHALRTAGEAAAGGTMYVTLEPCNHTGRTPPCSHAVARAGITRVVVGMEDPNPLVDGSGITYLRNQGVEVTSGILAAECREINRGFLKYIATGTPLVVMKAGLSLDGKITFERGHAGWITGKLSVQKVHRLRDSYDAILVGSNTVRIDDPSLTTRLSSGKGRDPVRIILDRELSISSEAKVYSGESTAPAWVFCSEDADDARAVALAKSGVRIFRVATGGSGHLDLKRVIRTVGKEGLTSVLVEGGAAIHGAMLHQKLFDYAHLFVAPLFAGDQGLPLIYGYAAAGRTDAIRLDDVRYRRLGEDMMISGELEYP